MVSSSTHNNDSYVPHFLISLNALQRSPSFFNFDFIFLSSSTEKKMNILNVYRWHVRSSTLRFEASYEFCSYFPQELFPFRFTFFFFRLETFNRGQEKFLSE
eukprot:GDKK01057271.1.p1 GENE.GDKK01057271.1~~GDKK01057271.1.p1  ORF type:complete len:102 (-),score=13.52 GDKK01057271.1:22-327(-)